MGGARGDDAADAIVVVAERPVVPRWVAVALIAVAGYLVLMIVSGEWLHAIVGVLVLSNLLLVVATRGQRVVVDASGVTWRGIVRSDPVPWSRIRRITLDWRWRHERFDLDLADGRTRSLRTLAGLGHEERADERERFLAVLHRAAERSQTDLIIHIPRRGVPLEPGADEER